MPEQRRIDEDIRGVFCALRGIAALMGGLGADARVSPVDLEGLARALDAIVLQGEAALSAPTR